MKRFFTLCTGFLFVFSASAQTFSYSPSQVLDTELITNEFSYCQIDFATNPAGAIQFGWQVLSNDLLNGWSYSTCDYTNCYPGVPSGGTMTAINATEAANGTTGFIKITIGPFEVEGSASVKIYVYDINDYNVGDTITFNFNHVSSLGLEDQAISELTVYPNPADDQITFNNINADMGTIQIVNAIGAVVYGFTYNGTSMVSVDVSAFEAGIYFVTYLNDEGIRETQKLIIQ